MRLVCPTTGMHDVTITFAFLLAGSHVLALHELSKDLSESRCLNNG